MLGLRAEVAAERWRAPFGPHGAPHPLPHPLDIPRLKGAARDPDRARGIEPSAVRRAGVAPLLDGASFRGAAFAGEVASKQGVGGCVHTLTTPRWGSDP
ncbi:MAG: hypothetical protein AUG74_12495 [Bacteroidetes bacterium 13_1_20CM_4_60_6]|nr:MAG: hypothetical protein AUG74_12495 [Bacteroidetes bacterium 13_1_20CM_4_60_6]